MEAKFAEVAQKSVEATAQTIEASVHEIGVVAKGGLQELQMALRNVDESKVNVLTLIIGKSDKYEHGALLEYVKKLSQYRNFKFVVTLDQNNKLVGYAPAWKIRQILEMSALGEEFVQVINDGRILDLQRYPGMITRTISTKATNKEALQEMTAQNLEALVVTDEEHRLRGVVEREQVLSKLLLAMAK